MNSLGHNSSKTFCKLCLSTTASYSVSKTSSRCLNRKHVREAFQFLRFCHLRRRSCQKKQRKWLTSTVGLSLLILLSAAMVLEARIVSCSLSREFWAIRRQTVTSTKPWWSSLQKFSKLPLTSKTSPNWKKRSTGSSGRMHSTFRKGCSLTTRGRRSILSSKKLALRTPTKTSLREWSSDLRCPKKTIDKATSSQRLKLDPCSLDLLLKELLRPDLHSCRWYSLAW